MCIEEELDALRDCVAELDSREASEDDWRRIEARAFLAILGGHLQLSSLRRDLRDMLVDTLNQLRVLRAYAQHRAGERDALAASRTRSHVS